jgi:uncharacterized protein (DUF1501 family)
MNAPLFPSPGTSAHDREHLLAQAELHGGLDRRAWLKLAGLSGLAWLTPAAELLARRAEAAPGNAESIIFIWLSGGPSQLETFDPHPNARIAAGSRAIATRLLGVLVDQHYPRLAEVMQHVSLVRSVVSKEGDHERGAYMVKTGYRPNPTVVHPTIGAICCHQLPVGRTEIPRHVSILPDAWPGHGGLLGAEYDAFKTYDPLGPVPDITARVPEPRMQKRLKDLDVLERSFARGRERQAQATLHGLLLERARTMMTTEQIKAFDVTEEPAELRARYGNTPFGRGCLAARRLIEQGVRCVEVTLAGWDTHANNHEQHAQLAATLDPALATLLADLHERELLGRTIVICTGEFGRTPRLNALEGRDHWPHGFTMLLAGGGLRPGVVLGETDPEGGQQVARPVAVADIHATVLTALGIDPQHEEISAIGRPIKLSEGQPISELLGHA